jgi:hypothetical protein
LPSSGSKALQVSHRNENAHRSKTVHGILSSYGIVELNGCDYCLSAHAYLGKNVAKLDDNEITINRDAASGDAKATKPQRRFGSPKCS